MLDSSIMFKIFILSGLVFFVAVGVIVLYGADKAKSATEEPMDWGEYGRVEPGELSVKLEVEESSAADTKKIPITIALRNDSTRVLHVFKVRTGEDGELHNNIFTVTQNGTDIDYAGKMVKIAFSKSWFVDLASGETFSNTINLLEFYPMDLKSGDVITVTYAPREFKTSQSATIKIR